MARNKRRLTRLELALMGKGPIRVAQNVARQIGQHTT